MHSHDIREILSTSMRSIIYCIVALLNYSSDNLNQYCCHHINFAGYYLRLSSTKITLITNAGPVKTFN